MELDACTVSRSLIKNANSSIFCLLVNYDFIYSTIRVSSMDGENL